jgi:GNAT superfamily N-acetyltransferase
MFKIEPVGQFGNHHHVIEMLRELAVFEGMESDFSPNISSLRTHVTRSEMPIHVYLAYDGDEPAGVVVFYVGEYSTFKTRWRVYLEDVYVKESHRGKGLLRKLLKPVAERALRGDIEEIAFAVLDWNEGAQKAYDALGAEREGRYEEEGGSTWLRMVFRIEAIKALAAE